MKCLNIWKKENYHILNKHALGIILRLTQVFQPLLIKFNSLLYDLSASLRIFGLSLRTVSIIGIITAWLMFCLVYKPCASLWLNWMRQTKDMALCPKTNLQFTASLVFTADKRLYWEETCTLTMKEFCVSSHLFCRWNIFFLPPIPYGNSCKDN